ncbi:carboxylesterase [Paraneptunicella aestuarii]|uniref:alpha/beta hydrolase n=1 Tax=Paraneptunicella aestuarii TaxID=2831148 RepID=UPI001E58B5CE|nr:carboxylesterase [Paraneptunicella aestuarii]UAA38380.1 carboxylesterase [Paraneptunicella aestuarii]
MSVEALPYVEVNPATKPDAVVIWLHGLGDSGNGFAPIVPQLHLPVDLAVRFVFPHAPIRPITVNNGMQMRAWYDLKSLSFQDRADMEGVEDSSQRVEALIEAEIANGVPSNRIILAGFSQGGVIAYHLGLRYANKLAGLICLSTYMCEPDMNAKNWPDINKTTPIFSAHGVYDDVVPIALGRTAYEKAIEQGFNASWAQYPMQHNVCLEQIQDISKWLQARLK